MNLIELYEEALRDFSEEYEGKLQLDMMPNLSEIELPFYSFKYHIEVSEGLLASQDLDNYQHYLTVMRLLENRLKFIIRYEKNYESKESKVFCPAWINETYEKLKPIPMVEKK